VYADQRPVPVSDFRFYLKQQIFASVCFTTAEIEALNPENGHQMSKPGDFGSNPESWQPYINTIASYKL